jgi:hypothetical protein
LISNIFTVALAKAGVPRTIEISDRHLNPKPLDPWTIEISDRHLHPKP